MRGKRFYAALVLAALLIGGVAPTASAVSEASVQKDSEKVSGVVIQYAAGINSIAKNGQPTGANLLRGQISSEDLGGGLYVLNFADEIEKETVSSWVKRMVLDRRIAWAELNIKIEPASLAPQSLLPAPMVKARPASGPRSLVARAAVRASAPDQARVRLSWRVPASRFGAEVVGYRVLYSSNGGSSYRVLVKDTGSNDTRLFISDGIRAGISYRFRVRAITNDGSGTDTVGAASNITSAKVRTAPKPVVITSGALIGPGSVFYLGQSLSDRGGFNKRQLLYRAIATSADGEIGETSFCSATSCLFPDLIPEMSYSVEVFSVNPLGTSSSRDVAATSDSLFTSQWYLWGEHGVSMPGAWKYAVGDGRKVVAVIDTGIREHQQISKALTRNTDGTIYGYDFVSDISSSGDGDGEDSNPKDEGPTSAADDLFHGTHVAGIIAAEHDFFGTAGVSPGVKILPIRALGREGGTVSNLLKAINWAAGVPISGVPRNRYPVSVINLSLGSSEQAVCSGGYARVFETVISKGITVVAAAGNESRASLTFPANCPGVIAVVATQSLGDRATYSNFGSGVLLSAPGGESEIGSTESPLSGGMILSIGFNAADSEDYALAQGTSMAVPIVSGIVALMYSMLPNIDPARVRTILAESATPFVAGSNCAQSGGCGAGIVNAQLALALTSALR